MKNRLIILLSALFLIGFSSDIMAQSQKEAKKKNSKEEVLFDVSMHCQNCQKKIERQVAFEKGVTDLRVDLPAKTVWVQYRADKTNIDTLKTFIESLGYEVAIHKVENEKTPVE